MNPDNNFNGIGLTFNGNNRAYLTSGNTYTVQTSGGLAQTRGTDTLTWKSSNPKVASIKANQGSFTATLKALQQGRTTITVTSKVTKKTIARYHIAVKAVGKANSYGGDYETGGNGFYDDFIKTVDPYYEGRMEVLTVSNSVTVTDEDYLNSNPSNDRTWVKFTAPSYGEYTFSCNKSLGIYYNSGSEGVKSSSSPMTLRLEEGQEIYFKVIGSFTLSVSSYTDFTKLTTAFTEEKPLQVGNKAAWISFTATEDNYYTFNCDRLLQFEQNGSSIELTYNDEDGWYAYEKGMKAGETIFIKVSANGKLYVTKREFTNQEPLAAGGKAAMSFTKDNKDDTQYVKFTAGPAGEYTFTYKPSDKINVRFLAVDGQTEYYDGDAVLTRITTYAEDTADTPAEATATLFMDAGETIVIAVSVKPGQEFADDTKIDVEISTKVSGVKELAAEQTVTKGTAQMFAHTIPNDKAATRYTLTATEDATVTWYYNHSDRSGSLAQITGISDSFTVTDGKVVGDSSLKAGDKIYIKVEAASDKDSKVTLTSVTDSKIFDTAAPASVVLGANGDAEWYTFAVRKTGYYQVTKKVTAAPEGSAAQNSNVVQVDSVFSKNQKGIALNGDSDATSVVKLTAGDHVFMIQADSVPAENVKTTVTLSVKEIVPTAIAKGDTEVKLAKGETQYYTFKRVTADQYTIKWASGADVGTPVVQYTTGDLATGTYTTLTSKAVNSNDTYTIKVKADNAKDLSGKLQVAAETKNFLASGKTEEFTLTAGENSKTYKFTLPEDSALGYVVTVENTSTVPEDTTAPTITVRDDLSNTFSIDEKGKISKEWASGWKEAFTTRTITITARDVSEAAEGAAAINATGRITIRPVTVQNLSTTAFKVNKGDEPKWYTWTVPEDSRYTLDYAVGNAQNKNDVTVTWYKKNTDGSQGDRVDTKAYLTKGQELYVKVVASSAIADAGVDVTLKAEKLKTTLLTLTNGKAEAEVTAAMVANGEVYYTFKADAYAKYTVKLDEDETELTVERYHPGDGWSNGQSLEKDDEILIAVSSPGKLTVTKDAINELILDQESKEITLESGESAAFVFNVYKVGYYDFTVNSGAADLRFDQYGVYDSEKYLMDFIPESGRYEFSITNSGDAEAKLTVTPREVTPVTLELGENSVQVEKGRAGVVEFIAPESYWYTVSCSEGSVLQSMSTGDVYWEKGEKESGLLLCPDAETTEMAKVTIAKVMPESVSGEEITVSLRVQESKWFEYTATEAGIYTFERPGGGVDSDHYNNLNQRYTTSPFEIRLAAGEKFYIRVVNNSNSEIDDVKIVVSHLTNILLGHVSVNANEYQWIIFTAPEDGTYTFYSVDGNDPDAWFFHDMSVGDDATKEELDSKKFDYDMDNGEEGFNFSKTIELSKDETVYIAVGHYMLNDSDECDVYVSY